MQVKAVVTGDEGKEGKEGEEAGGLLSQRRGSRS